MWDRKQKGLRCFELSLMEGRVYVGLYPSE